MLNNKNIYKIFNSKGIFHLTSNHLISEIFTTLPLDWVVFDMEASPLSTKEHLLSYLQSLKGSTIFPFVRVSSTEHTHIEQILDLGVKGIIVPKVHNIETCKKVIQASKYPPFGSRGLNPVRASNYFTNVSEYIKTANNDSIVLIQIESQEAILNLEEMITLDGIDGIFVGCGDLAMDLGTPSELDSKKMKDALNTIIKISKKSDKIIGIFAYTLDFAEEYKKLGFNFISLGNDIGLLREGIHNMIIKYDN